MAQRLKSRREAASGAAGGDRRETARWATKHLSLYSPGLGLVARHLNGSGGHVSAVAVELPVYNGVALVPGGLTGFRGLTDGGSLSAMQVNAPGVGELKPFNRCCGEICALCLTLVTLACKEIEVCAFY